ncbi:hypothetical protein KGM_201527 [Danaus plexippus plexippus]|uniref:Uncharacterized protein n=1 Tax=Danaus plexippus plexippus TaxID=278856 RepID=A0A212EP75_DANPL|nr:hypothetical protein KGM_201527 [Danaus plexippus plexippus]
MTLDAVTLNLQAFPANINGLALALGGSGTGSPSAQAEARDSTTASRAPSPPPSERQHHTSELVVLLLFIHLNLEIFLTERSDLFNIRMVREWLRIERHLFGGGGMYVLNDLT